MKPPRTGETLRVVLEWIRRDADLVPPVLVAAAPDALAGSPNRITQNIASLAPTTIPEELAGCQCVIVPTAEKSGETVRVTIGRSDTCDISVMNVSVSKRHATLEADRWNAEFFVVDDGSRNGTFVNGVRTAPGQRTQIYTGARIAFGQASFVFVEPQMLKQLALFA